MTSLQIKKMVYAAVYLAIALILPFLTGQIPEIGTMLSPMHIPALLCGFMCGWTWGMAVGFVAPLLRSVLFNMPVMIPMAVSMAFELAVYGGIAGILRRVLPKQNWCVFLILGIAMVAGRMVYGAARAVLAGEFGSFYPWLIYTGNAFKDAVPGIILQIALVPAIVIAMERAGLGLNKPSDVKE